jgi:hypothetical protein
MRPELTTYNGVRRTAEPSRFKVMIIIKEQGFARMNL